MDALLCVLWMVQVAMQPLSQVAGDGRLSTQQQIDSSHSSAAFAVHPHLQEAMTGKFESPTGTMEKLTNGRLRVDFSLKAASVVFPDRQRITTLTRSEAFFDAVHHPIVHFRSNPFPMSLLREGGRISGALDLRGVSNQVQFVFAKAGCAQPGFSCALHAAGKISRNAFGMTRYKMLVQDNVDIVIDVRFRRP